MRQGQGRRSDLLEKPLPDGERVQSQYRIPRELKEWLRQEASRRMVSENVLVVNALEHLRRQIEGGDL